MKSQLLVLMGYVGLSVFSAVGSAQDVSLPPSDVRITNIVIDRQDSNNVFAIAANERPGIYVSKDGGSTWAPLSKPGLDCLVAHCRKVAIDPADSKHLMVVSDRGIHSSHDAGATWSTSPTAGDFNFTAFDPFRPNTVFATTADCLLYGSRDDGLTWNYIGSTSCATISDMAFSDLCPDHLLLIADSGILESGDQGRSWRNTHGLSKSLVNVTVAATVDLSITEFASAFTLMAPLSARFVVTNNGPDSATGVAVTIQLPTNLSIASANIGLGGTCSIGATQVICQLIQLGNSQTVEMFVNFRPGAPTNGGPVTVSASVLSDAVDAVMQNNSVSASANYVPPPGTTPPVVYPTYSGNGGAISLSMISMIALLLLIRFTATRKFRSAA